MSLRNQLPKNITYIHQNWKYFTWILQIHFFTKSATYLFQFVNDRQTREKIELLLSANHHLLDEIILKIHLYQTDTTHILITHI